MHSVSAHLPGVDFQHDVVGNLLYLETATSDGASRLPRSNRVQHTPTSKHDKPYIATILCLEPFNIIAVSDILK